MKKNILRCAGIIGTLSILAGCANPGVNPVTESKISLTFNSSPSISRETVNLSKGIEPLMIERMELCDISEEQKAGISNAALSLLNNVLEDENENILISPYSINMALGMTELGASGDTLKQMEETVNGGLSRGEMQSIMYRQSEETESD